jgi:multisubunit Na+/H+ antiporter MnhB subunit
MATASSDQPVPARLAANVACAAVLAVEAIGSLLMWAPIPLAWIWVGARAYDATGSLVAGGGVALLGFAATVTLAMAALARLDRVWVALRRRAGHDQADGALTQVVVVSATLGLLLFLVWYYVLTNAFVIPFMPSR